MTSQPFKQILRFQYEKSCIFRNFFCSVNWKLFFIFPNFRPLTKEELAQRHEEAKQRLAQRQKGQLENQENQTLETAKPSTAEVEENDNSKETRNHDEEVFVAFARIFSGKLKRGAKLYVLGPKYDPNVKDDVAKICHLETESGETDATERLVSSKTQTISYSK